MIDLTTQYDNLYVDIRHRSTMPFQIFIGPRGTGKTFSALREEINNPSTGDKFIYLRNDQREARIATSPVGNAFKKINSTYNVDVEGDFSTTMGMGTFSMNEGEDLIGYAFGLTTFSGARSIDLSDCTHCIFEEFIPEKHVQKRRNRGEAFLNFVETVARNREVEGDKPFIVYLLANAIALDDEILLALGVVNDIQDMIKHNEKRRTIRERGVYIELVDVAVTEKKRETALYKLGNKDFNDSALRADFYEARLNLIEKSFNQRDFVPFLSYDDICIYQSKQEQRFHIAATGEQAKTHLLTTEQLRLRTLFRNTYGRELGADRITFDNFVTRNRIETALKIKN